MNDLTEINGLKESKSFLENKEEEDIFIKKDILYNKEIETENIKGLYYDEGFTVYEYDSKEFSEPVNLMTTIQETFCFDSSYKNI